MKLATSRSRYNGFGYKFKFTIYAGILHLQIAMSANLGRWSILRIRSLIERQIENNYIQNDSNKWEDREKIIYHEKIHVDT